MVSPFLFCRMYKCQNAASVQLQFFKISRLPFKQCEAKLNPGASQNTTSDIAYKFERRE